MKGHKTITWVRNPGIWYLNLSFLMYKIESVTPTIFHCRAVHLRESTLKTTLLCPKMLKPFHPNYNSFISLDSFQDVRRKRICYHLLINTFNT